MSDTESDASTSDSDVDSAEERPAKVARVQPPGNREGSGSGTDQEGVNEDLSDDDDDDEDDYRRKKRPRNDLILDMAEVSDGEDDYETDGEDGIPELLPAIEKGHVRSGGRNIESDPSGHMSLMQQINELDGEKIVEAMAKRFSGYDAGSYVVQDDEHSYEIQQQKLLPGNHGHPVLCKR